jgi:hypothetical protein
VRALGDKPDIRSAEGWAVLSHSCTTLRRMSVSVNGMLQAGKEPVVEGSIVKTWAPCGSRSCRTACGACGLHRGDREAIAPPWRRQLRFATMIAPKLTLQGGTDEVLRGIIARGLGLR